MDAREKLFVHEFIITGGNAYKAALHAGYAESTARHASDWITEGGKHKKSLNYKPYIREAIDAELKRIEDAKIADEVEVMKYLTSVMRKESQAQVVVVEGIGDGLSKARMLEKPPDEREATKAAEILARIYGMFNQTVKVDVTPVVLEGYDDVPD